MCALHAPHPFYISTSGQSREIDTRTIEEFGIESFTLMETAGYCAAQKLIDILSSPSKGVYLCGKGNNAGDTLVVARYLIQHGHEATLVFISGTDDLSDDTLKNFHLLEKVTTQDADAASLNIVESWTDFDPHRPCDFIVDGMLGTGLTSELRGEYNEAVEWANKQPAQIFAIDIPTGLHGDNGKIMGKVITADRTFSFGTLKRGFYLNDGPETTGEISYCELPFPNYLKQHCNSFLIDDSWVRTEDHGPPKHKYDAGVLYVLGGSEGLTGAAILAARSAWAEGIGAVILICPHGNLSIYEENLPQIIKKPVGDADDNHFKAVHLEEVMGILNEKKGKVLLGPGLGRNTDTVSFVDQFVSRYQNELIIDADALWCLSQDDKWEKPGPATWLITPHPGELSTLLGEPAGEGHERLDKVIALCKRKNITTVSKGFPVIIGTPEGKTYLTSYDTRRFSRAGFGDILAGKIGAYWALGYEADKSSALALLKGKHIAEKKLAQQPDRPIEPTDFV